MCNKRSSRKLDLHRPDPIRKGYCNLHGTIRLDSCMINLIHVLNMRGIWTLGCCCGHGKYNMSIVYQSPDGKNRDLMTGTVIPRHTRFYVTDDEGYYYIPELVKTKVEFKARR